MLQLKALQDIAASDNAKVVVPYEATSLMGAAEVLLSTLRNEDMSDASTNGATPPFATAARPPNKELPPQQS